MLRNCRYCGRVLTTPPGTPCAHCLAEEDAAVERIHAYLEQGGAPMLADVARETSVPLVLLRRLMRGGRIALSEGTSGGACVLCGRSLEGGPGRLCRHCAAKVEVERLAADAQRRPESPRRAPQATAPGRRSGFYSRMDTPRRDG